jgi:dihydrolipoamide dehydrogenase
MTSREALASKRLPKSLAIVGAGAIGVEFAYFYRSFGVEVTLIEMLPEILPQEDEEAARAVHRAFDKQGIAVHAGTACENIRVGKDSVKFALVKDGARQELEVETLLSAVGVVANTDGLLSARIKLEMDRNYIKVGADYQTSVKGVYAAGDIIGPPWLAHVATFEAVNAVNGIFGHGKARRVKNFPSCTYCQPQVASVGLTEKAARERGLEIKIGKFPFLASGKAVAAAESDGFVKLVTDAKTGEIYGGHIVGAEATELIAEVVLAMDLEATAEELHLSIHAHPTMGEAVMEAAAASFGEAIHI